MRHTDDELRDLVRTGHLSRVHVPHERPHENCVRIGSYYAALPEGLPVPQTLAQAERMTRCSTIAWVSPPSWWTVVAEFDVAEATRAVRVIDRARAEQWFLLLPAGLPDEEMEDLELDDLLAIEGARRSQWLPSDTPVIFTLYVRGG